MKQTKMSKQQKEILNILRNKHKEGKKKIRLRTLSKEMAGKQGKIKKSHSASISRSTKRLEKRGLVRKNKYNEISLVDKDFKPVETIHKHVKTKGKKKSKEKSPLYGKTGKHHPAWKGNDAKNLSVSQIHKRIAKIKPKPKDGKCAICNQVADKEGITKLELSNLKEHHYTLNPDDYQYAHHSCQMRWDVKKRKEKNSKIPLHVWKK